MHNNTREYLKELKQRDEKIPSKPVLPDTNHKLAEWNLQLMNEASMRWEELNHHHEAQGTPHDDDGYQNKIITNIDEPVSDKSYIDEPVSDNSYYYLSYNLEGYVLHEGWNIEFMLTTNEVADGTVVPYVITGISSDDLTPPGTSLTGQFTVINNIATISYTLLSDALEEGVEIMTMTLQGGPVKAEGVAVSVSIIDN